MPLPEVAALCGRADLTIAANLLSHLPIVPDDDCESRRLPVPEGLGARIVADPLAALPGRVCRIADIAQCGALRSGRARHGFA